jgi:hypothetical protein
MSSGHFVPADFAGPLFAALRFLGKFCLLVSRQEFRWTARLTPASNKENSEWGVIPIRRSDDFGFY